MIWYHGCTGSGNDIKVLPQTRSRYFFIQKCCYGITWTAYSTVQKLPKYIQRSEQSTTCLVWLLKLWWHVQSLHSFADSSQANMTFLTLATASLMVLLPLLVFYYFAKAGTKKVASTTIPGLEPSDKKWLLCLFCSKTNILCTFLRLGNIQDLKAAGSLHEFLSNLHGRFGELASFWMGKQLCVSVASSKLFKEVQVLFDRPRKCANTKSSQMCLP